jgi:hypothetical protein
VQVSPQSLAFLLPGSDQIGSRLDQLVSQLGSLYGDREKIGEQGNNALIGFEQLPLADPWVDQ